MDQSRGGIYPWKAIFKARLNSLLTLTISSVVSNPLSDWAMQPYPVEGPITIRASAEPGRHAKVNLEYWDGHAWEIFRRITGWTFDHNQKFDVGIMACSPGNQGFDVVFWDIIAQDYSELAFQKGIVYDGGLNPNLHIDAFASGKPASLY